MLEIASKLTHNDILLLSSVLGLDESVVSFESSTVSGSSFSSVGCVISSSSGTVGLLSSDGTSGSDSITGITSPF